MSLISSSAAYLAMAIQTNAAEHETFEKFFECWVSEQNSLLQDLISAARSSPAAGDAAPRPLIDRVVQHYERYYRAKARWARADVFAMLSPTWLSSLEDAFLWVGGWRPSMAFHLLYSKSGLQLEAAAAAGRLPELAGGLRTADLADLSPAQLSAVDVLQRSTIREEREITEELARCQEAVAGADMVELSHAASEMILPAAAEAESEARVEAAMEQRERGLEEVLERADELRMRTLKGVLAVLTPMQNVHFLIAAAELHLRIHEWGRKRDVVNGRRHKNH